jgi:hypothetical protein
MKLDMSDADVSHSGWTTSSAYILRLSVFEPPHLYPCTPFINFNESMFKLHLNAIVGYEVQYSK